MRAAVFRGAGGPEVIHLEDRPAPVAGPGEAVVEVAAAGLNRADLLQRRGLYPAPPGAPADIPGLELSGTVCEVGPGTRDVKLGDRVMAVVGGGAMASHIALHERTLVPVPDGIDVVDAAAIPEVFATAHDALFSQAGLAMGETVLLHAVGSGIGTAAV
jgi:NADPH:quinone reductase